jgi:ribonucleoside-diphosphate reductase alpha chain
VFDCAFKAAKGNRSIAWHAHVTMMAAAQPFLSGAISKTVNMPSDSTVEDIEKAYIEGWRLGLKALAIYRDGSKQSQPLNTSKAKKSASGGESAEAAPVAAAPARRRLPDTRNSITHKFVVGGHEGYITVGLFEDHTPGELFITMAKEGSTIGGLMDVIGTETSLALQYGVPLEALVTKFSHARFEPSGWTSNPDIPHAKSVVDYIFRFLGNTFIPGYKEAHAPKQYASPAAPKAETPASSEVPAAVSTTPPAATVTTPAVATKATQTAGGVSVAGHFVGNGRPAESSNGHSSGTNGHQTAGSALLPLLNPDDTQHDNRSTQFARFQSDAPACDACGSITVRNGNCYLCHNCGQSMGCS